MLHFTLHWDMTLSVYDDHGVLMAKSAGNGTEEQTAGYESFNSKSAASYFEMKFTQLVRDESVRKALSAAAQ